VGQTLLMGTSPEVRGAHLTPRTDDYSMLQTIEETLGLRRLRNAACTCTSSLNPLLAGG
jgi:hypothetical protein